MYSVHPGDIQLFLAFMGYPRSTPKIKKKLTISLLSKEFIKVLHEEKKLLKILFPEM
jgi:hypothetical protein